MRVERHAALAEVDRTPLLDFWVAAWAPVIPAIQFSERREWLSEHLDALLREGAILLLVRDEAAVPCGFLTVHPRTGEVNQLAVAPGSAGRGLGRVLMDEAKRLSPAGLHLRVNQVNPRAVRFYEAAGFAITGEAWSERSGLPVFTMAWPAPR